MAMTPLALPTDAADIAVSRISSRRCQSLLAGAVAGHLAMSQGALPVVLPVTCTVDLAADAAASDSSTLVVRAGPGLFGQVPGPPGVVAFVTSAMSLDRSWRWEVLAQGRAELVDQAGAACLPPSLPLLEDGRTVVLRVRVERLSGWRYGQGAEGALSRPRHAPGPAEPC